MIAKNIARGKAIRLQSGVSWRSGSGWGGSVILMDLGRRMTVSYMMNKMGSGVVGSDRGAEYVQAIYEAVTP